MDQSMSVCWKPDLVIESLFKVVFVQSIVSEKCCRFIRFKVPDTISLYLPRIYNGLQQREIHGNQYGIQTKELDALYSTNDKCPCSYI